MKKYLTKPVIYSLYGVSLFLLVLGFAVTIKQKPQMVESPFPNHAYDILNHLDLPVIGENEMTMIRPYQEEGVVVAQNYYDYRGEEEDQKNSLIYYEDTYMQSTGVSYSKEGEEFDVLSVLDGEVIEVKEDALLGNSITIKHSSNVKTVYQSISNITVKEGDTVTKGMIIGKSGKSNINADLGVHLYFELIIDNISVNPEEYYDKTL